MTALVSAELLKARTVRTTWAVLGVLLLFVGVTAAFVVSVSGDGDIPALTAESLSDFVRGPGRMVGAGVLILGILAAAGEFRHRTSVATFLGEPRRLRVLAAKLAAAALAGAVIGLGIALVALAAGVVGLGMEGVPVDLGVDGLLPAVAAMTASTGLHAMLGVALGSLLANPTLAVGTALGWALVVEGFLPVVLRRPTLGEWLPGGAADMVLAAGTDAPTSWAAGAGTLLAYTVALALPAALLLRRREM